MMETNLFTKHLTVSIVILLGLSSVATTTLSDKRLCFDSKCSVPVSLAKTLMPYHPPNIRGMLGFNTNVEVKVFSKSAGNRTDLWGVEINGQRGYVPKNMIREYKILQKNLQHEVPTEHYNTPADDKTGSNYAMGTPAVDKTPPTPIESSTEQVNIDPSKITPSYEIVDGTTIHFGSEEPSTETNSATETNSSSEKTWDEIQLEKVENEKSDTEKPVEENVHNEVVEETLKENATENVQEDEKVQEEKAETEKVETEQVETEKVESEQVEPENVEKVSEEAVEQDIPSENVEEQPTLSVQPSLVSSTINFVSSMFDSGPSTQDSEDEDDEDDERDEEEEETEQKKEEQEIETKKEQEPEIEKEEIKEDAKIEESSFSVAEENLQPVENEQKEPETDTDQSQNQPTTSSSKLEDTVIESPPVEIPPTNPIVPTDSELPKSPEVLSETEKSEEKPVTEESENILKSEQVVTEEPTESKEEKLDDVVQEDDSTVEKILEPEKDLSIVDTTEPPVIAPLEDEKVDPVVEKNVSELSTEDTLTSVTPQVVSGVSTDAEVPTESNDSSEVPQSVDQTDQLNAATERTFTVGDLLNNRNLLNVNDKIRYNTVESSSEVPVVSEIVPTKDETMFDSENTTNDEQDNLVVNNGGGNEEVNENSGKQESSPTQSVCEADQYCSSDKIQREEDENEFSEDSVMDEQKKPRDYWESVMYVGITAFTTLLFSLGYYYIENSRRDSALIAKINKLERELMVATKENVILDENLQSTSTKLNNIEDQSFGSNEMVLTLKSELEASKRSNAELEEQVVTLEKELESASEAGLELERMLREVLSSQSDDNPLAKSIEDLQTRLNAQQAANESLTNALNLKVQENESLSSNLNDSVKKCEQLETEVKRLRDDLQKQSNMKIYMEQTMSEQIQRLESQFRTALDDKNTLRSELKEQEQKVKELSEVIKQYNVNNLDFAKLFEVAHVKAEVAKLTEERDELKIKLSEVEGAHQLLEEHVKIVDEQLATFTEQCKLAEKEKKDAETRLEVLSNFFKEKEAQRQKEEAVWLEKQGEVASTVERIQTMQNEIQNYKQQVEMLKREIIDQEKEYKCQIAALETKSHEQWVLARQNERRLEESKAEASQLRFRLTMVEKNLNDSDGETKMHRLETNGESATSPGLFLGAESSSSPIMFGGGGLPPPPPGPQNFMYAPPFAAFLPPPPHNFEAVGQRPAPLGGRLPSPPPMSPPLPSPYGRHRSPPPHYASEHPFPPPPLPHHHHPSMFPLPMESLHPRGEEAHIRNSAYSTGLHRDQRTRNHHKGSLHSSGESLDKPHHNSKV